MNYQDYRVEVYESITDLPASCRDILEQTSQRSLFLGSEWFTAFSSQVGDTLGKPRWFCLIKANQPRCILPLLEVCSGGKRFLQSLGNYYTPYFDVLSGPTDEDTDPLPILVQHAYDLLCNYSELRIYPLTYAAKQRFLQAFQDSQFVPIAYRHSENWRSLGIESFDRYWRQRPTQLQRTVHRKQRKLVESGNYRVTITTGTDIDDALADYHHVYYCSWKVNEPYPTFIDTLARIAGEQGWLRLGTLFHNDQPVASQLWLVHRRTAYIYKLAYNPEYKQHSVGSLLSAFMFRYAIEHDEVQTIDYLTGGDCYKRMWMDECRPLYGLQLFNMQTLHGHLLLLKERLSGLRQNLYQHLSNARSGTRT